LAVKLEAEYNFGIWKVEGDEVTRSASGLRSFIERKSWQNIWPRTLGGDYSLAKDKLEDLADQFEEVKVIREFGKSENLLKDFKLVITADGWNRLPVLPFTQASGRNTPTGGSVLTGPKWLRLLMQAPPGHALISVDVVSEENALAAAFAENEDEIADYVAGNCPYLGLAIRCGAAPAGMTKESAEGTRYALVRKQFKVTTLSTQYGAKGKTVAQRLRTSEVEGDVLVAQIAKARKKYWDWSDAQVSMARKNGCLETIFGWKMWVTPEGKGQGKRIGTKTTTLINWPIQAAGAEILRLASVYLERAGYGGYLGFPHHDALYCVAPIEKAQEVADAVGEAFAAAGDVVTDGKIKLRVDTHIYAYPDHYHEDADAQAMYDRVMEIMEDLQDPTEDEWNELRLQMLAEVEKKQREKGRDG
jgi:DNA polymerase-1